MLEKDAIRRTLARIAHEIVERNEDLNNLILLGIKTRGVPLAKRLAAFIFAFERARIDVATLDISEFRDDLSRDFLPANSVFDFDTRGKDVVIVDDVLCTARTARAGIEAAIRAGRPKTVQLAVLVDRGHRELPLRADYVGKNVPTSKSEQIRVMLEETDGKDMVVIAKRKVP